MDISTSLTRQSIERVLLVTAVIVVITAGALATGVGASGDPPPLPAAYYGNVTANDSPIPDNYTIEAEIDGEIRGTITTADGKYGSPDPTGSKLLVNGTTAEDGEQNVTFYVANAAGDRVEAKESVNWESGSVQRVDLSVDGELPEQATDGNNGGNEDEDETTGGVGGGGSAAGPSPTDPTADISMFTDAGETTIRVSNIPRSSLIDINTSETIVGEPFTITSIQMQTRFDSPDFRIEASHPQRSADGRPSLPASSTEPIGYASLELIGADLTKLTETKLNISVNQTSLPVDTATTDVVVYQYVDGEWISLESNRDGDTFVATLEAPEIGNIALVTDTQDTDNQDTDNTTNATPDDSDDEDPSETTANTDQTNSTAEEKEETDDSIPGFGIIVTLVAFCAVIGYEYIQLD
jgi:hypothetical protein